MIFTPSYLFSVGYWVGGFCWVPTQGGFQGWMSEKYNILNFQLGLIRQENKGKF